MKTRAIALLTLVGWTAHAAAPPTRYVVSTDTVRDTRANITWQRVASPSTYTFAAAQTYCAGLTLGGFSTGWRVPTIKELQTLVDVRSLNPAIDGTAFTSTASAVFWSSSPATFNATDAWGVSFAFGVTTSSAMTSSSRVRCVR